MLPRDPRHSEHTSEAEKVAAPFRFVPIPVCRPENIRSTRARSAADDSRPLCRRLVPPVVRERIVAIETGGPFPYAAEYAGEPPRIPRRREACCARRRGVKRVAPPVHGPSSAAARVFPFGFGRQTLAGPFRVRLRRVPAHMHNRLIRPAGWILVALPVQQIVAVVQAPIDAALLPFRIRQHKPAERAIRDLG